MEGRTFDRRDGVEGERVLVISASLADALFPEESAVGQRVTMRSAPGEDDWFTVIGVVGDVNYLEADATSDPQLYQAHGQSPVRDMGVVVRTSGDPGLLLEPVKSIMRTLDPQIPLYAVNTLDGLVGRSLAGRRFSP